MKNIILLIIDLYMMDLSNVNVCRYQRGFFMNTPNEMIDARNRLEIVFTILQIFNLKIHGNRSLMEIDRWLFNYVRLQENVGRRWTT